MRSFTPKSIAGHVVGASAIAMGVRIVGLALGYAAHVLLSRLLGLSGYGEYVVALGWTMVLVLPARLGFDYSALRYATVYLEQSDKRSLRGFLLVSTAAIAGVSLLVGAIMVVVIGRFRSGVGAATMAWAALVVAPIALVGVPSVIMRAARRLFASQFYDGMLRPALLILLAASWGLLFRDRSPATAMALTALAAWLSVGALMIHFRRTFTELRTVQSDFSHMRGWFALSLPLLGLSIAQEVLNQLEIILLGGMASPSASALFASAARLASLMAFALAAFGFVSGPLIASAYERRDMAELQHVTTLTARLSLLSALGVALVLIFGGRLLLSLFGPGFEAAYVPLVILIGGGVANGFTGIVVYLATLTGRERPALMIFLGALSLSLALNVILIPRLGVVGAAISSSATLTAWNLAMLVYVRRVLGIDASAVGLKPKGMR